MQIVSTELFESFEAEKIEEEYESKLIQSFKGKRFAGISLEIEKDKGSGKRGGKDNQKSRRRNRQKNKRIQKKSRTRRRWN